ncbi:MAG: OmpW family protein [Pseudomonadota bacterium]
MKKLLMASVAMAGLGFAAPASADDMFSAKSDGDWMVRLRGIAVIPNDDDDLGIAGLDTSIDTAIVPELDITYFFTPNIAAELILATAPHEVSAQGAVDASLGDVWLLPPTLTLQYHVTELGAFKPYVGAGVNYTIFYNEDGGAFDVDYDDSFGFVLQAGLDYEVAEGLYVNADVKKVWLSTDVTVTNPAAGGAFVTSGDVDIDPWIIGFGAGYRF